MDILVTGGTGFLGKRLCQLLAEQGHQVRALCRREAQFKEFQHPNITPFLGNLNSPESLEEATKGVQQVYHLAALASDWAADPRIFYKVNFEATLHLLDAAHKNGVERTVVTSTMGTIGPPDPGNVHPVDEEHIRWVDFFTDYEVSKSLLEERIGHRVRRGENIVVTNPTRIFGPGVYDRKNGLIILMDHFLNRPFAVAPGVKEVIGNYVYVDDVAWGHIHAMKKGRTGEKYILGGHNLSFGQFFEHLREVSEKKGRVIRIPFGVIKLMAVWGGFMAKAFKKQPMVTHTYLRKIKYDWPVSSAKATEELGYEISPLNQSLQNTLDWLNEYKKG